MMPLASRLQFRDGTRIGPLPTAPAGPTAEAELRLERGPLASVRSMPFSTTACCGLPKVLPYLAGRRFAV